MLTPAFYSRLVCYQTLQSAFAAEVLAPRSEENQTAQMSDKGSLLASLLHAPVPDPSPHTKRHQNQPDESVLDIIAWRLVYLLRRPPVPGTYPFPALPSQRAKAKNQPSTLKLSDPHSTKASAEESKPGPNFLDAFVRSSCGRDEQREYRRALVRVFLANGIALGSVELLWWYRLMARGLTAGLLLVGPLDRHSQPVFESWVWRGLIMLFLCVGWSWLENGFL